MFSFLFFPLTFIQFNLKSCQNILHYLLNYSLQSSYVRPLALPWKTPPTKSHPCYLFRTLCRALPTKSHRSIILFRHYVRPLQSNTVPTLLSCFNRTVFVSGSISNIFLLMYKGIIYRGKQNIDTLKQKLGKMRDKK